MESRLMILKRIGAVYGLIEEAHSLEVQLAAAEVAEVGALMRAERSTRDAARMQQREAMWGDDLLGQSALAVREELAIQRNRQLEPMLKERCGTFEHAQLRYFDSRMWSERIKSLIGSELSRLAVEQERRIQAASDDRFLAQRQSSRTREENRGNEPSLM